MPNDARQARLEAIARDLLLTLGEDVDRPGLADTPRRWAKWWQEFIDYRDDNTDTTFEDTSTDQMVVVRGLRVWSLCEHHLLPFWCDLTIGYIPTGRVLGLSKFGRLARVEAHRLNIQESMVRRLATRITDVTGSPHVAVVGEGEHLCMTMRGPRTAHRMTTSDLRGHFRTDAKAREEFMFLHRSPAR